MPSGTPKKRPVNLPVGSDKKRKTKIGSSNPKKAEKAALHRVFTKSKSAYLRKNTPGDCRILVNINTFQSSLWNLTGKK